MRVGVVRVLFLGAIFVPLFGQEVLDRAAIYRFMDENNPYVYTVLAHQRIQDKKVIYAQGAFDTKLGTKYDEKQYPLSESRFSDVYLEKPMENGLELLGGYRKAYGTQEYNNIKTSDEGEMRLGVKLPVVSFVQGTNQHQMNLKVARLDAYQAASSVRKNLRELYYTVIGSYYQLLFRHELLRLDRELLINAQERYRYIEKRVKLGDTAPIILTEARQLIHEREQRMAESNNHFENARQQMASYLNLSEEVLGETYAIPSLPEPLIEGMEIKEELKKVIENRPELRILELESQKLNEERAFAEVMRYPEIDLSLYGVHDRKYNDGFKVSLEMAFPIERRKYEGKSSEIQIKKEKNAYEMKKSLLEAQRVITTSVNNVNTLRENLRNVLDEISLVEQVEKAEKRKFELGQSELFVLNQRELRTLQVKQKKYEYQLRLLLSRLEVEKETGEIDRIIESSLNHLGSE